MRTKITLGALLAGLSAVCLHSQISTEGDVSRAVTNTSSITVTGVFEIGRTAAGTLSVLEGGTLTSSTLSVGSNVGGLGSVNLSGGTLDIYYSLRLGSGGTGMMTFSSGTLNIGETLTMSAVNNGRSTFYMTGGRLTAQDAFITQGAGGNNSAATLSFLGGTAIFSSEIRFGNGTSSMLVDGGDVITGRLHGAFSGGTATLTLNSGSITLTDSSRQTNIGYSGSMALYVNGGSLVQNQSAYFVLGTTSATLTGTGTARFSSNWI